MGMVNFNPVKNAVSNATSYLNKIFKSAPAQTPQQNSSDLTGSLPGLQTGLPGYGYNPYQVQTGDTFESIAKKNNMDPSHIQAANNGMLVPPPKGSYINIPNNYNVDQRNRTYGQTNYASMLNNPALGAGSAPVGQLDPGMVVRSRDDLQAMVTSIQNSTDAPNLIPGQVLGQLTINGAPATAQAMQANGYTYNQATGNWVKGTTQAETNATLMGGTGNGGSAEFNNTGFMQRYNALGTPFLQQKRWDPSTHRFVSIGRLIKQGKLDLRGHTHKGKSHGGNQQVAQPVNNANPGSNGPNTVLGLHLGSG